MSEKAVDCIDLGSWARFTPSLVDFLNNDVDAGARLVFYVGQPLLAPDTQLTAPGLANKLTLCSWLCWAGMPSLMP